MSLSKSKIFYFDYGNTSVYLFDPDVFMDLWESDYIKDPQLYKLIKKVVIKEHELYKTTFYDIFERLKTSTEIDQYEKDKMLRELEKIKSEIKEGDFVVVDTDYKLAYYYYFDGYNFMKTIGDHSQLIPEQSFKLVEQHGTEYFENIPYDPWVKVPRSYTVMKVTDNNTTMVDEQVSLQLKKTNDNCNGYYFINDRKYFF